ncbi:hypothetical protein [Veronia pacifica]|uniref:hypothetical protein n=1 Tax=Veronia pacifica TaxID=1080227 RepID=UPI0024804E94|nr:hypothetical protein [Veronia pacifica]
MRYHSDRELFSPSDVNLAQRKEAIEFLEHHPDIQFVDLLLTDMNGIVRGKRVERDSLEKVYSKGVSLPISIYGMTIKGLPVEETGLGLEIGESDASCYPVPGSLSMQPWQKRPIAQLLMSMYENSQTPMFADPRMVLQRVLRQFKERGLTPVSAFELEFYLLEQGDSEGLPHPPFRSLRVKGRRPLRFTPLMTLMNMPSY